MLLLQCHQVKVLAVDCGMKMNIYRQFLYTDFKGCNVVLKVCEATFVCRCLLLMMLDFVLLYEIVGYDVKQHPAVAVSL